MLDFSGCTRYNNHRQLRQTTCTAGLCNGSTTDSDSVCLGSNPCPAATEKTADSFSGLFLFLTWVDCRKQKLTCVHAPDTGIMAVQ